MLTWTKTEDGWQLSLGQTGVRDSSLPRLEIHRVEGTWVVCVLTPRSGRARTGTAWTLEDAQHTALVEAQEFLDRDCRPPLEQALSSLDGSHAVDEFPE